MKTIWKGSISFGLVNIPIELYSAVESHSIAFKILHEVCNTPVENKRWCPTCQKEVVWSETVKGYKLPNGEHFIISQEELNKLKPQKTDTINIVEFVDRKSIDSIYLNKHYYALPNKKTDKAFFLFIKALGALDKVAVGQFVMRDKEYACMIQPYKNGILLNTLNYAYEVRELRALEQLHPTKEISPQELKLAEELIKKLSRKKFNIKQFKNNFAIELQKRIEQASKGVKVPKKEKVVIPQKPEINLEDALRASLDIENLGEKRA